MSDERKINVGGKLYSPDELVGKVIDRKHLEDETILFVGKDKYFFRNLYGEGSSCIGQLKYWNLKPKTRKVKVERWLNIYEGGYIGIYLTKEDADRSCGYRIAVEHFVREYEVEVEK